MINILQRYYHLAMPELMINAGWMEVETVEHYVPRFLHALNALSECKTDKAIALSDIVIMMDKPAAFNPDSYKTLRGVEADAILSKVVGRLSEKNYVIQDGDSLYATKDGLQKREATDLYWKRSLKENYDCH
jgi:hypothetical protein